jgi:segregation and condensation protein B
MDDLKNIIESLLFVSDGPIPVDRIKKVLEIPDAKEIKNALRELAEEYELRKGGFILREVAGGFQIRTRPEYAVWIKKLVHPGSQRLSNAALETLAIIAYKQPIIRSDIEFIRGVDCGGILRMLMEKKLIRVLGKKEIPGRPLIYATTKQFLEIFDLKDLKDLPTPKEIQALGQLTTLEKQTFENPETPEEIPENRELEETDIQPDPLEADERTPPTGIEENIIPGVEHEETGIQPDPGETGEGTGISDIEDNNAPGMGSPTEPEDENDNQPDVDPDDLPDSEDNGETESPDSAE